MRKIIENYLDATIRFLILIVAFVTPLIFFSFTTEFYDIPKLVFLIVMVVFLIGLWTLSWVIKGKISITRTPLDIPLILFLLVIIVSTYFSISKFSSIYGNFPQVHGSAVSWITYILLYFVAVSHFKKISQIKNLLYALYLSSFIVCVFTLLSFFHIFLPFSFTNSVAFTPTGGTFSTVAFLVMLLPIPLFSLLKTNKFFPMMVSGTVASLFGITIALTGSVASLIILFVTFFLCFFLAKNNLYKKNLLFFFIPVLLVGVSLIFAYLPLPMNLNRLQILEVKFPKEIQLPFSMSWKISASVFRDSPVIGTGPSSYLFNFTQYKPPEFNQQNYWNVTFNNAYNEFLQELGTLGILGFVALVVLCLIVLSIAKRSISSTGSGDFFLPVLSVSATVAVLLLTIHSTTLTSTVVSFFIFAALVVSQKSLKEQREESDKKQFNLMPLIAFILFLVIGVPILYQTSQMAVADYYHRMALNQAATSGSTTYQYLQKAENLSPYIDLYRIDMAQTNFALANALASQKGPSKATPNGSLTDQDRETIQTLLSQAISEGRMSVALSPLSSRNWVVLAETYRNISGIAQNALSFSLNSYVKAIQVDPLNPVLRVNIGGMYYAEKNYSLAVRYFTDAVNLKPDYANAYYNLAISLRDSGDLQDALVVANQLVVILQNNTTTPDYKTASQLVSTLKSQIQDAQNQNIPKGKLKPTNTTILNSKLKGGVNVPGLNSPVSVTPAPSIKPNPNTLIPQVTNSVTKKTE